MLELVYNDAEFGKIQAGKTVMKKIFLWAVIGIAVLAMAGCGEKLPELPDSEIIPEEDEAQSCDESAFKYAEAIEAACLDIFEDAAKANTLGSLETKRRIIARLGENGYAAVDNDNQIDMTGAEQVKAFCRAVDEKENARLTIMEVGGMGFRKFDLAAAEGIVTVTRGYYQYDPEGYLLNRSTVTYPADLWEYTEEGYLIFEGSYFFSENFVLTLGDTPERTALRVLPLDEGSRELNRKYILPIGYSRNNLFLCNWNEEDYGDLDFYDIFERFYPVLYGQPVPYTADENAGIGAVYQVPEDIFEKVIMTYFRVDKEVIRSKAKYISECAAYEYRPRGFYEAEPSEIPYPEVVSYMENRDGTITLFINAVYPDGNTSRLYSHKTVIRLLDEGGIQYVSNQMIFPEGDYDIWWHSDRLSEEEWQDVYGEAVIQ